MIRLEVTLNNESSRKDIICDQMYHARMWHLDIDYDKYVYVYDILLTCHLIEDLF